MRRFDVAVVGGGIAGTTAATEAARFGLSVALIEREKIGGVGLWSGAVPTKALLACASVADTVRRAAGFGIRVGRVETDFAAVLDRVRTVVRAIHPRASPERIRSLGIETMIGDASFTDRRTLAVGHETIEAKRIFLATGCRPSIPQVDGLVETGHRTHRDILEIPRLPARLVVIGGGPEGVEFAQAFARLGSQVTLVEQADRILGEEDAELAILLGEALGREGVVLLTKAQVVEVLRRGDAKVVAVRVGEERREIEVDEILVSAGRVPNIETLNLGATEIETTRTGIVADRRLRTTQSRVWAIGDVNGLLKWARAAEIQARVAVHDAIFPWRTPVDPQDQAWAIYTDPELAHAGMTEEQARRKWGDDVRVYRQAFGDVDRAVCLATTVGQAKIVCDDRHRIVGGHILAAHAGEILPALARAVAARDRPQALAACLHAYPTLSDGVLLAARQAYEAEAYGPGRLKMLSRFARWHV